MSYESSNNFYSHNNNPNPRAQQMLSSNYYSRPPPQSSAMNQYQGYPSSTSHQIFPSYDPYESRSTGYYPPYASSHEQQRPVGTNYYGENHVEPSVYLSKDSNSLNDSNSMMVSNDYQTGNTSTPMTQMPQRNIGYHNSSMMPAAHPSLRQQQQQGDPYGNSNASPYSYANSNMMNARYSVPPHRSAYSNDVTSGKVQPYPTQSSYPAYSNGPSNNYPTASQSTWPPLVSSNTTESDSNYSHSQMQTSSSTTGTAESRSQDDDSNPTKAKGNVPESPNYANISSNVFDDAESSNSSFSDSPSVSNEKAPKKPKNSQITQSEILNKLREMGNEPERNLFVDRLQKLWEEHHVVCRKLPTLARQTIDLYRLYLLIREQNGFEQFSKTAKNRHWRDIALKLHIPNCSTAALTMKQKYIQLKLFHYECKYDRGSIDPEPILADIEKPKEKRSLKQTDEKSMNSFTETPSTKQPETDYQPASASVANVNSQSQYACIPSTVQFAKKPDESYKVQLRAMPVAFPPNSVEATTLSTKFKRRKLTAKDIPPIDPMKLLMSLRAGLLAETTWALDTINIMLSDDQTHTYFRLKQMPGLLQAIIDNYLKCLTELFDELKVEHESQLQENQHESNQEQASVIYRIESNCLNKYQRKYSRPHDIKYEHVYDDQGNLKSNPESVVDLQNTDDLCYIQTHFDPMHVDDHYYENLHHSHHSDDTISSEEHDQEPTKTSVKRLKSLESDISPNYNEEFLQHYKRKFQFDEDYSSSTNTDLNAHMNVNNQQENASAIFTRYSFGYDQTSSRCICISSILRNLSFIPGNDIELVKYQTLIHLLARLLLLRHNVKTTATSSDNDQSLIDYQSKNENPTILPSFSWSECLINIRENTLVTLTNIAGVLIFDSLDSDLINQLIDGLLHWSTCYSDEAMDPIQSPYLSAQRLSIEILTKLSIHEMNMDFILATPPVQRISSLFRILTDWLNVDEMNTQYSNINRSQTYTQREFAIVLLNALLRCDSNATNIITHIPYTVSLLINFLEDYEKKTNELTTRYGSDYVLRISNTQQAEQFLFTTNDMLKRAANCLLLIAHQSENTKLMKKYEDRILNLSISNIIDRNVGRILTDILHYCS